MEHFEMRFQMPKNTVVLGNLEIIGHIETFLVFANRL